MEPNNSSSLSQVEADPDTIKMFCGQIPRSWDESDCRKLFEEFGPVFALNILRDRNSNCSRGCCFVTFYHRKNAIEAQNALHNVRILPTMNHAMQVKPADSESQRKLFIGMLSKSMSESEVRTLFKEFGQVEDCTVLRDSDGRSKGCAFLSFVSRNCAHQAIRKMHQSKTLEGCSKPIVVKFADTPKDKETKKSALAAFNALSATSSGTKLLNSPSTNSTAALLAQLLQPQQNSVGSNLVANQLISNLTALIPLLTTAVAQGQIQQQSQQNHRQQNSQQNQLNSLFHQQKIIELLGKSGLKDNTNTQLAQLFLGVSQNNCDSPPRFNNSELDFFHQQSQQTLPSALLSQLQAFTQMQGGNASSNNSLSSTLQAALSGTSSSNDYSSLISSQNNYGISSSVSGTQNNQSKGPDGCNLFIYHLPQDFSDSELIALFSLFGNVISAKVFIDKQTNMSKCFGFVSYDSAVSAQKAISGMNGFQIGSKRLKVQIKRGKDKPYQRQSGNGASSPSIRNSDSPSVNSMSTIVNNFLGQKYNYDD